MEEGPGKAGFPVRWLVAVAVVAFLAGGISGAAVSVMVGDSGSSSSGSGQPDATERRILSSEETAVSEAVAQALPAVVTIINEQPPRQDSQGRVVESVSVGSGVIVDPRGFIVTNEHVIHDPGKLSVVLNSGEERQATVVSNDAPFTDLALLRIPPGGLKALAFSDPNSLKLGQTVVAIGSALYEFRNSVSVGVVSGAGRRYLRDNVFMEDLIQTDAAINNGNSGGPLINTRAEVVGLTTTVIRRIGNQDTVSGIAFAISGRTIQPIVQSMIERGQFPRPYLGIDHLDIDDGVARANNLRLDHGALVRRVIDASPAQGAGIRPGDIILKIGRNDLNADMPFINALSRVQPNEKVTIQYSRDGRLLETSVQVVPR